MDLATFKQLVADYMNRDQVTFDVDSTSKSDKIIAAANNAKLYAQKLIRFELAREDVILTVDKDTGGDLSSAVRLSDSVTPVKVRSVESALIDIDGNQGWVPIAITNRGPQLEAMRKVGQPNVISPTPLITPIQTTNLPQVVKSGNKIYVTPWPAQITNQTTSVQLRVHSWLPDYRLDITGTIESTNGTNQFTDSQKNFFTLGVQPGEIVTFPSLGGRHLVTVVSNSAIFTNYTAVFGPLSPGIEYVIGNETDFFLEECRDWLMYRTIQELNFFLKEDQRVVLSAQVVQSAWEAMKSWNAELGIAETDLDLD